MQPALKIANLLELRLRRCIKFMFSKNSFSLSSALKFDFVKKNIETLFSNEKKIIKSLKTFASVVLSTRYSRLPLIPPDLTPLTFIFIFFLIWPSFRSFARVPLNWKDARARGSMSLRLEKCEISEFRGRRSVREWEETSKSSYQVSCIKFMFN